MSCSTPPTKLALSISVAAGASITTAGAVVVGTVVVVITVVVVAGAVDVAGACFSDGGAVAAVDFDTAVAEVTAVYIFRSAIGVIGTVAVVRSVFDDVAVSAELSYRAAGEPEVLAAVTVVLATDIIIALSAYPDAAEVTEAIAAAAINDVIICFDFKAVHLRSFMCNDYSTNDFIPCSRL